MADGYVEIHRDEVGYRVVLNPPLAEHPPLTFAEHKAACGYAGGLRLVLGRKRIDLAGD